MCEASAIRLQSKGLAVRKQSAKGPKTAALGQHQPTIGERCFRRSEALFNGFKQQSETSTSVPLEHDGGAGRAGPRLGDVSSRGGYPVELGANDLAKATFTPATPPQPVALGRTVSLTLDVRRSTTRRIGGIKSHLSPPLSPRWRIIGQSLEPSRLARRQIRDPLVEFSQADALVAR